LHGDSFFLRSWQIEDAEWYVKARDEVIFKWTTEKRNLTVTQTEAAIRESSRNPSNYCLAIVEKKTGRLMGNIALVRLEKKEKAAEIMYWLAPEGRGRGLATKSVRLLSEWAFRILKLEQILLKTHPENVASQRVAERAGFYRQKDTDPMNVDAEYLWFERRKTN